MVSSLLAMLDEPIMSSTLILPDETLPMNDPVEVREALEHEVDIVIDGGFCGLEPTSVVDLVGGVPVVRRLGKGDVSHWQD